MTVPLVPACRLHPARGCARPRPAGVVAPRERRHRFLCVVLEFS